jgi:hypothetical protein
LIASDGYEYETLADRLLGRPKECTRNGNLRHYAQTYGQEVFHAYRKGFDEICPGGDPGPSEKFAEAHCRGLVYADYSGKFTSTQALSRLTRRPSGNGLAPSLPAPTASIHPAN